MSNKEKLPKLVDVYRPSNPLSRRQLPLVVDENLTLVMDIKNSGIIYEGQVSRAKELEDFALKFLVLPLDEFKRCLQISKSELLHVLNQNVPCVGCRRSVERLYIQLLNFGHPTLDPVIVKQDGSITIREEKQAYQSLASIFHDHAQKEHYYTHMIPSAPKKCGKLQVFTEQRLEKLVRRVKNSVRLAKLIENQPKRNKKSVRCLLHSLDSQRSRPLTPVWRDVWDCMKPECKKDVCIIEAESLHATLETYLRKHRFCGECRTKVLKAYTLLVEDPEPAKEKGYVSSLYSGIKRCLPDKHIHLKAQTDYITKLINRAEPELLGSRRERHAKTLEIAQEEVLTCLGICMYERLHRIYMRVREEERTCQLFAAVAIHTLSRSFETAVEKVRGVSQLELLYEEFEREEQAKQIRKEAKKIKRKRRKGKSMDGDEKENCCGMEDDKDENEKDCQCSQDSSSVNGKDHSSLNGCYSCGGGDQLTVNGKGGQNDECDSMDELDGCKRNGNKKGGELRCTNELWLEDCKCENNAKEDLDTAHGNDAGQIRREQQQFNCKCDNGTADNMGHFDSKKESGSTSDHSHDCGYSSENNNGCCETGSLISSISSSPEGSELACSDSCCQEKCDFSTQCRLNGRISLQDMLEDHSEDDDEECCYISAEEVREFKSKSRQVFEKRQELRETLQRRFAQFCVNGPPMVSRLFVQTKYASN